MRRGDWIQTFTGRQFWPLDPRAEEVCIEDIAHALSMICRYTGHCRRFLSVAEHCCHVSDAMPPRLRLAGLLHDASEAYVGDVSGPLKRSVPLLKEIERPVQEAIWQRFDIVLDVAERQAIKNCDMAILHTEMLQAMAAPPEPWADMPPPLATSIRFWPPELAERSFLRRFRDLTEGEATDRSRGDA